MATVNIVGTCTIRSSAQATNVVLTSGAIYGDPLYGTTTYGSPLGGASTLPTYSARPMAGNAVNYTTVQLTWSIPNNGYQLRLVRNSYSQPAAYNNGVVLSQFAYNATPLYLDTLTTASGGMWLYYSLFMLTSAGGYWQRAADCQVMLPTAWGYGARMYSLLPAYYQTMDDAMDDPIYESLETAPATWSGLEGLTWSHLTGMNQ